MLAMKSRDEKRGWSAFSNHHIFLLTFILGNSDNISLTILLQ